MVTGRRAMAVALASGALALAGSTCLAVVVMDQQRPPRPPLERAGGVGEPTPTVAEAARLILPTSAPVSVTIPAIGVRSALISLGQRPDGSMEVPGPGPDYNEAGWYRYSSAPGSRGPAVIVGHVDSAADGPSVFFRLGSLRPADTVRIGRADGSVAVFAVDAVRRYHKTDFPTRLVYGATDHAALRLITCGGNFDTATGHYLDNVVVLASLVASD